MIGTGQSLAVGDHGGPVKSTTQPYGNLKLSTGSMAWPIDPNDPKLTMAPLVEPVGRQATSYPSSWPTNISGETAHAAMANQVTALVKAASGRDFVGVHGEVGENGQCMTFLEKNATPKGVNGRSYQAAMIETKAIAAWLGPPGKSYGVARSSLPTASATRAMKAPESDLYQLWSDYNADLAAITGQKQRCR